MTDAPTARPVCPVTRVVAEEILVPHTAGTFPLDPHTPLALLLSEVGQVIKGYTEAMLWANAICGREDCEQGREIGDCEHTLDAQKRYDFDDFDAADQHRIRIFCEAFVLDNLADFREYLSHRDFDPAQGSVASYFGHDLALTRNGHGTGFWDRGLGELGDRLSEATKPHGESHVDIYEDSISLQG